MKHIAWFSIFISLALMFSIVYAQEEYVVEDVSTDISQIDRPISNIAMLCTTISMSCESIMQLMQSLLPLLNLSLEIINTINTLLLSITESFSSLTEILYSVIDMCSYIPYIGIIIETAVEIFGRIALFRVQILLDILDLIFTNENIRIIIDAMCNIIEEGL